MEDEFLEKISNIRVSIESQLPELVEDYLKTNKKINNQANHTLMTVLMEELPKVQTKDTGFEEVSALIQTLPCLERDPENCPSRFMVKLEAPDHIFERLSKEEVVDLML